MKQEALKVSDADLVVGEGFVETPSVEIAFEDLTMHLKSNGKCILSGVTGSFSAGALVALMGPSGGGKTTFMNALCGRANYGTISGDIKINGREGGVSDIPRLVGFVPQDDIMHADLTVHQTLRYNALLRLPRETPGSKVNEHVTKVINVLGLSHIAHNLVGSPAKRGISGGQKKRVNIGMELAAMPAVIFMDEPTSGLDGAATIQLAHCLGNLRKSGLTIVCVIHQPRKSVFDEFTHLLLLGAGGRMCYCGETSSMERYFIDEGFRLPPRENPADWMIDIVSGLVPRFVNKEGLEELDATFTAPRDLFEIWDSKYKGKGNFFDGPAKLPSSEPLLQDRRTIGRIMQTLIFLQRCARQWDKAAFLTTNLGLFVVGTLFGLLAQDLVEFSYVTMKSSVTAFGFLFYMIATINSRGAFGLERLQYLREFRSGTSSSAYWLAKVLWNLINVYMNSLAYSLPLYWLMPVPAQSYWSFFDAFCGAAWYHMGLGMVFTVLFPSPTTSLLMCIFVPMTLELAFAGDLTPIKDMGPMMLALSRLSCGRWYNQEMYLNEIREFPAHTREFPAVQKELTSMKASVDDAGTGLMMLWILGALLRLWALIVLALLKYSEGNTCLGRIFFLVVKQAEKLGISIEPTKKDDTAATVPVLERKPSLKLNTETNSLRGTARVAFV